MAANTHNWDLRLSTSELHEDAQYAEVNPGNCAWQAELLLT